ncbi:hypothetical protein [Oceaniglobus indicus]|uniref:hypothetical protein n=1 Tax=Oceaniglobus indicus TaxID=2047749 RepID=UPI000C17CDAF|nr:hypothetical protein [Oceaniglobus indicus]
MQNHEWVTGGFSRVLGRVVFQGSVTKISGAWYGVQNMNLGGIDMALNFPFVLFDGDGFEWDIYGGGRINDGTNDAFDRGASIPSIFSFPDSFTEDNGREVVLTGATSGDFSIERKIYVPTTGGFARYLEIVTNNGPARDT